MPSDAHGNPLDEATIIAGEETLLPEGEHPSGETSLEPSTPSGTYTQEQVEKLVRERHSKLDTRISGLEKQMAKSAKAMETAERRATEAEAALTEAQKAKDEAELESIGDNPDALTLHRARMRQRERDAELTKRERTLEQNKAEHEEAIREALEFKQARSATEIASKYEGIDPATLLELTDGSVEKMEVLAQKLGTLKAKAPSFKPDSGLTSGGAGKLTNEQVENMPVEAYAEHPSVKGRYK